MKEFLGIVASNRYTMFFTLFGSRLKKINNKAQGPLREKLTNLRRKVQACQDQNKKIELNRKINKVFLQTLGSLVLMEVMFRSLFPYLTENKTWLKEKTKTKLKDRLTEILLNGFCLELIGGESLDFKHKFFIDSLNSYIMGYSSMFKVGCMGPQSSGKSTLLNYMFGTLFGTSQGRCTSGLYLSLQKIQDPDSSIRYLLIIDSEGLHNAERKDPEYDIGRFACF
jgi:hypothetical protein